MMIVHCSLYDTFPGLTGFRKLFYRLHINNVTKLAT